MDACPESKHSGIYPRGSVKGLPEPVVLGLSTPGMYAHWSGVEMQLTDPPPTKTTETTRRKFPFNRRGVKERPRKTASKSEESDRDRGGSTVRGRRCNLSSRADTAAEGGGSSHLRLGRMKGQSSSLGGETRVHGGNIVTTVSGATGDSKAVAKSTAADEKSTGQRRSKAAPVVNKVLSKGGKAATGSSLLGVLPCEGDVDDTTVVGRAKSHRYTDEVRLQQVRQLLWAQKLHSAAASKTDPEVAETPQNQSISTAATATGTCASQGDIATTPGVAIQQKNAVTSAQKKWMRVDGHATNSSDHRDMNHQLPQRIFAARGETKYRKMNADGICRVNLTVHWKARTRSRSDMQPPSVKSVTMDVHPGEITARFISRMVQMPPGVKYNDTQLTWGSFVLQPTQVMEEFYRGSWILKLSSDPPPELALVVPVGSLLVHPALCEAVGWRLAFLGPAPPPDGSVRLANGTMQVKNKSPKEDMATGPVNRGRKRSGHDNLLIDGWVPTKKAVKAAAAAGHYVPEGNVEDKELKELSNRALHPGRTDPESMSKVLREYGVVVDNQPCSLVDVGSGDGQFVNGLRKTFPQVGSDYACTNSIHHLSSLIFLSFPHMCTFPSFIRFLPYVNDSVLVQRSSMIRCVR